ncbi:hypothetical protein [Planotetraspora kaengkrachanensis]|uniref:Uncharacterized protein n=1 Tax=Planotetraspora kaengkrachanensis TaxID=575193 RepID=A0A8J3LX60_9ACTN|nr:hypothetical protein [Planotetraspora kaengkrachanensis]GIG80122.1 hypothetical protein Pka01_32490 [Planotetraspora kaengkrachanensis]
MTDLISHEVEGNRRTVRPADSTRVEVSPVENMTVFLATWLAFACLAAVIAQIELSGGKAVRTQALIIGALGTSAFGRLAGPASHRTRSYVRIPVGRPMSAEQTDRTANGDALGPRHAWRKPVIT